MIERGISSGRVRPVRVETIRARAYIELKQALIEGRFQPGELLTVKAVSEELGVGAMPVREAIQQLVTEGGLEFMPNRTVRVPKLSVAEVEEIFSVRSLLEAQAAKQAAANISPAELKDLKASYKRMKTSLGGSSPADALAANYGFHFLIYEAAHSPYLNGLIERLWLRVGPLLIAPYRATGASRKEFMVALGAQKELLDAIAAKDSKAAERAMQAVVAAALRWHQLHSFKSR